MTLTPDESTYGTRPVADSTPPAGARGSTAEHPAGHPAGHPDESPAGHPDESHKPPLSFGKFRIERELARGGMGRVVLASLAGAEGFEKPLVLKLIREDLAGDPSFVARFVEEAKIAVKLTHPNIVPVYELGLVDGTYYIAMEYVRGVSLAELVQHQSFERSRSDDAEVVTAPSRTVASPARRARILSPEVGAYVGAEICRALDYAHRRLEVVHRDVTPRNVMIDEEGHVRLIDFGVAQRVLTLGDRVFGSPGHMPPEQMRGQALGAESDVFAVGALLLELWSGHPPFRRATTAECEEALQHAPAKPSAADPALQPLDRVMALSVATDRTLRPRTAEDLGKDLRRFLSNYDASEVARELGRQVRDALGERETRTLATYVHSAHLHNSRAPSSFETGVSRTFATRPLTPTAPLASDVLAPEQSLAPDAPAPNAATPVKNSAPVRTVSNGRSIALVLGACMILALGSTWISAAEPRPGAVPTAPSAGSAVASTAGSTAASTAGSTAGSTGPSAGASPAGSTPASALASGASEPTVADPPTGAGASGPPLSSARAPTAASGKSITSGLPTSAQPLRAHLTLLCDPGTVAFVDGTPRGACPLRELALPAGAHQVSFHFNPTGETRGIQVVLDSARTSVIKADFTRAVPEIHEVR